MAAILVRPAILYLHGLAKFKEPAFTSYSNTRSAQMAYQITGF